jgi:hypothetical protein
VAEDDPTYAIGEISDQILYLDVPSLDFTVEPFKAPSAPRCGGGAHMSGHCLPFREGLLLYRDPLLLKK